MPLSAGAAAGGHLVWAAFAAATAGLTPRFGIPSNPVELERAARPGVYCEASGPRAALLGSEDGEWEAWVYPFKIAHGIKFSVELPEALTATPLAPLASQVTVRPESTTLRFSHMAFTLDVTAFVPVDLPVAVLLLDVTASGPLTIYADFTTDFTLMWPGGIGGQYSVWDDEKKAFLLTESRGKYAAYLGSPAAVHGTSLPAHNLPDIPTRMVIEVSSETAASSFIPIVIAGSVEGADERRAPARAWDTYERVLRDLPSLYQETVGHYASSRARRMRLATPDPELNLAAEWASVSLEKLRVCNPDLGCGLVAGLGRAGLSQRPGFGWFFGGDTFINSLALTSWGEFELVREAFDLLRRNQRSDGKMMHELSQSGGRLPWFEEYPYGYYHADTTPYYLVALHDFIRTSGDKAYLDQSWEAARKAYRYCLEADGDGDGLMENSRAGLGAVETGKLLGDLHTDVYLGAISARAHESIAELAQWRNEPDLARQARELGLRARRSLRERFYDTASGRHAFALTEGGAQKSLEATVWPAVGVALGVLEAAEGELDALASAELSADWGVRMLASSSLSYDPRSYNNGSIWPFLTGFASWAFFASERPHAGFHALNQNVRLTRVDALGYHPELLSGDLYQVIETAVPHQGFSSFGVLAPLARGLLGLEADALAGRLFFGPQMPPSWDRLSVENVPFGGRRFRLGVTRDAQVMRLHIVPSDGEPYWLKFAPRLPPGSRDVVARIDGRTVPVELEKSASGLRAVVDVRNEGTTEVELSYRSGPEIEVPAAATVVGSGTRGLKILRTNQHGPSHIEVTLHGRGGWEYPLIVRHAADAAQVDGADVENRAGGTLRLRIGFEGASYQLKTVHIRW
jgi:hypothetical protein